MEVIVSDRVMAVVLDFVEDAQKLICGYAPQNGRSWEEKIFYDFKDDWDMHSVDGIYVSG